jgi:hypothetical protein
MSRAAAASGEEALDFCPALQRLYGSSTVPGRSGRPFEHLGGLSTVNNVTVLRRILLELKPERTLEVGLACGGSALTFAVSHRDLAHAPTRQHIAIDAFQRKAFDDAGRIQLEQSGLEGFVDVREALSSYELPRLAEAGERFAVIYIDGSHQFESVFCDFFYCLRLLEAGGYMLFDDSSDVEVAKVIRFIQRNLKPFLAQEPIHKFRDVGRLGKARLWIGERLRRTQLTIFRKIKDGERPVLPRMRSF